MWEANYQLQANSLTASRGTFRALKGSGYTATGSHNCGTKPARHSYSSIKSRCMLAASNLTEFSRLTHSISISLRSINKPSDPWICRTTAPRLMSAHARSIAECSESQTIGLGAPSRKTEYVALLVFVFCVRINIDRGLPAFHERANFRFVLVVITLATDERFANASVRTFCWSRPCPPYSRRRVRPGSASWRPMQPARRIHRDNVRTSAKKPLQPPRVHYRLCRLPSGGRFAGKNRAG